MLERLKTTKERHKLLDVPEMWAITKIEASLLKGARDYFDWNGFVEVSVPHITKATGACENIDTLFEVDHFGTKAYLIQTGQLYLESLIPYLGKVYCIGSSFRSEPDVDGRHLTEFTLVEMELPCNFDELLFHIERLIYSMVESATKSCKEELKFLGADLKRLSIKLPFKKITYTEAIDILEKKEKIKWGDDLKSRHEKFLVEYFGNKPLFITHYPKEIKFFNMRQNGNPKVVNSADLCLPFSGEAVGSAEREYEYERLYKRLKESKMLKQLEARGGGIKDFKWYLDLLKTKKNVQHAGCGVGLNRVTQFVLGSDDIRTSTVFPQNRESLM